MSSEGEAAMRQCRRIIWKRLARSLALWLPLWSGAALGSCCCNSDHAAHSAHGTAPPWTVAGRFGQPSDRETELRGKCPGCDGLPTIEPQRSSSRRMKVRRPLFIAEAAVAPIASSSRSPAVPLTLGERCSPPLGTAQEHCAALQRFLC